MAPFSRARRDVQGSSGTTQDAIRAASQRLESLTGYMLSMHNQARDRLHQPTMYRPVATKAAAARGHKHHRRSSSCSMMDSRIRAVGSRQRQALVSDEEELGAITGLLDMKAGKIVTSSRPSSPKRLRRHASSGDQELQRCTSSQSGGSAFHLVTSPPGEPTPIVPCLA